MKGIRFYEEFINKRKGVSEGNCIAVLLDDSGRPLYSPSYTMDAIVGVFNQPNSPVASSGIGWEYLRTKCKRVPEARARTVHPALFKYLEAA